MTDGFRFGSAYDELGEVLFRRMRNPVIEVVDAILTRANGEMGRLRHERDAALFVGRQLGVLP